MEWSLVGLAGVITALIGVFKYFDERSSKRCEKKLVTMDGKLDAIAKQCDENRRETLRDRLQMMLLLDTDNKDTILAIAKTYFIDLKGNGEMWANFHQWAEEHKIDVKWYEQLLAREEGKL